MKWFRHYSDACEDEILSGIRDRLGTEGYGAWWLILEAISRQIDKKPRDFADYSVKKWQKITGISVKKLQKLLSFLSKNGKVFVENSEKDGIKYIKIRVPKILEIADEYTKRMMKLEEKTEENPEKNRQKPGVSPEKSNPDYIRLDKIRLDKNKKSSKSGAEKKSDSRPPNQPKIRLNIEEQEWENITKKDLQKWRQAYPACDVGIELARAAQHIISNPEKRKKNWRRYITNWLSRQQDWGGTKKENRSGETETQRLARQIKEKDKHD
jgi:hypothetical protein